MIRKLFALLLLLTGLAALGQPAHARVFEAESARASALASPASAAQPGPGAERHAVLRVLAEVGPLLLAPERVWALPLTTVTLQADRARE